MIAVGIKTVDVPMLGGRVVKMMISDKKDFSTALKESNANERYLQSQSQDDDIHSKVLRDHQHRMRLFGGIM